MSNSIWRKYDIKDMPSLTREILARNGSHHNVCIINREDWKQGFCEWIDRWAYVSDLIAQADKAERLQKGIDLLFRQATMWSWQTAPTPDKKIVLSRRQIIGWLKKLKEITTGVE